jgi:protein-tyrosine phosphatase
MTSVLVVCVGNICRSPIAERLLARDVQGLTVASAGLNAVVGHGVQTDMADIARKIDIDVSCHSARQFTADLGAAYDLILVMEKAHRNEIARIAPHLMGRALLLDHWSGGEDIADPYRQGVAAYQYAFEKIMISSQTWAAHLAV